MKNPNNKDGTPLSTIEKAMHRLKSASSENARVTPHINADVREHKELSSEFVSSTNSASSYTAPVGDSITTNYCELDFTELNRKGFLTPDILDESLREEYRVIRRPLLNNARGKGAVPVPHGNLIVVTSSMPGEGKTYNSLNLAISFAMEQDIRVLLIDGDVIKPSLTKTIGLSSVPGLTDLLSGKTNDLTDILYKTNVPKLTVIPAGNRYAHDTELLSSDRMKRLTEELAERYPDRIVLFDAPPILATSHARVMVQYAGQIVLVVEAGKTLEHSIKDAVSHIASDKVVGVILNKGRGAVGTSYYGNYGTYGAHVADKE